ncbi:hypothetical protein KY334_06145 [Candidatus Woesearchaeota archaeon]|nr:hypothetical protein [Candidatus Woesearchaeota archaeon]
MEYLAKLKLIEEVLEDKVLVPFEIFDKIEERNERIFEYKAARSKGYLFSYDFNERNKDRLNIDGSDFVEIPSSKLIEYLKIGCYECCEEHKKPRAECCSNKDLDILMKYIFENN